MKYALAGIIVAIIEVGGWFFHRETIAPFEKKISELEARIAKLEDKTKTHPKENYNESSP